MTADDLKRLLGLVPHGREGGFFAETYRAHEILSRGAIGPAWPGPRSLSTAIYYLLTPETFSALHRLRSDEVFHFYLGDPVEMLQLLPGGGGLVQVLGTDLGAGMRPQVVVPRGVWQGLRLVGRGSVALLGTTICPGFDFEDFELGQRDALIAGYPEFSERILSLTGPPSGSPKTK